MPYAQDRLLVIWLATVFKVCGSPETNAIAFDSLREVARSLGKASSGQQRQRIEAGFLRLFDATFLATDSRPNAIRRERYQLMQRMRLRKESETRQPNQHTLWPNVLVYDPVFATRKARATMRHWHGVVKRLWPDCPNELARDDTILIVRAGYAIKHGRLPAPEEFGVRPLDRFALERMHGSPRPPAIDRKRMFV